jgi:hypothetical protein
MINPAELVDNLVAMLRSIPDLVAEMDGDPKRIYAYHDHYPKKAIKILSPLLNSIKIASPCPTSINDTLKPLFSGSLYSLLQLLRENVKNTILTRSKDFSL